MVTSVTSLTGNGLKDWLIQRATALYFAVYTLGLLAYICWQPQFSYEQWRNLFHNSLIQVATAMALFAFGLHAWIGIWTVATDYIKCTALRISVLTLVVLLLMTQVIWGLMILWGQ